MPILNFGSLNLDHVYQVDHIVAPGETILSDKLDVHCGGKGLNQSIALARAGASVRHAGMIGPDGGALLDALAAEGVDVSLLRRVDVRSGNAIIQVAADGQNSIVLFGGANRANDRAYVDSVLSACAAEDIVLLQNELNLTEYIIEKAAERGLRIALNPSPCDARILSPELPRLLSRVWMLLLNEVEGAQITGEEEPEAALSRLAETMPRAALVLTLGGKGVLYRKEGETLAVPASPARVVDTTAAGDTFTGYFLAAVAEGLPAPRALERAGRAAALTVSRAGAAVSIPRREEVDLQ